MINSWAIICTYLVKKFFCEISLVWEHVIFISDFDQEWIILLKYFTMQQA